MWWIGVRNGGFKRRQELVTKGVVGGLKEPRLYDMSNGKQSEQIRDLDHLGNK